MHVATVPLPCGVRLTRSGTLQRGSGGVGRPCKVTEPSNAAFVGSGDVVGLGVGVATGVLFGVGVGVAVCVGVLVGLSVGVLVGVELLTGICVGVLVGVFEGVRVAVLVGTGVFTGV